MNQLVLMEAPCFKQSEEGGISTRERRSAVAKMLQPNEWGMNPSQAAQD